MRYRLGITAGSISDPDIGTIPPAASGGHSLASGYVKAHFPSRDQESMPAEYLSVASEPAMGQRPDGTLYMNAPGGQGSDPGQNYRC